MGIDFGSKRIGLAFSDESNVFALPYKVLLNSKNIVEDIVEEIKLQNITHVVIGESKDYHGNDNPIMVQINIFIKELKTKTDLPISFEPEFMTSVHAEKLQGKHDLLDASSAALILQSFIERQKNSGLTTGL